MSRLRNSDPAAGKRLLMEAAARLAARQGAGSLVLREIAREAGLNHNTFYRHFDDIELMLREVIDHFSSVLRQGLSTARATVAHGETPTLKVVGWLFDFAAEHRDVFVVAMRERYGPPGPLRAAVRLLLDDLAEDMVRDLLAAGYLPKDKPPPLRRIIDVSINEVFRSCLEYLEAPERREELLLACRELFEIMVAGLVARGGSSASAQVR